MKIGICSDLHHERSRAAPARPETAGLDALVMAGGIDNGVEGVRWAKALDLPVIYVAGNHEFWGGDEAAGPNVRFLERGAVALDGARFLGCTLWTDYGGWRPGLAPRALEMNDHREIMARPWWTARNRERYRREAPWDLAIDRRCGRFNPLLQLEVHNRSVRWLKAELSKPFDGPTVVVTHHAPSTDPCWTSASAAGTRPGQAWSRSSARPHPRRGPTSKGASS